MTRRAHAGFTIIEMLVSLGLGAIIAAAAFQLHAAFTQQALRQQQISDMQQSLRVAEQVITKSLRNAGAGLDGGALSANNCAGTVYYYGIQFSSDNTYADPKLTFATNPASVDTDPDWVRAISADSASLVAATANATANLSVTSTTGYSTGDLFVLEDVNPAPSGTGKACAVDADCTAGLNCVNLHCHRVSCQRYVSGIAAGVLQHNNGQVACNNQSPGGDSCVNNIQFPTAVFRAATVSTVFRVDNTTDPTNPTLDVSFSAPGVAPVWQVVADGIEDMQIALILRDGTVCGRATNAVDSPSLCDPANARALRVTLVARSRTQVPGFNSGRAGGFEDEALSTTTDGYLRRALTTEVELRNNP